MTDRFDNLDATVDRLLTHAGSRLVLAAPLGLGKPHRLLNAITRRRQHEPRTGVREQAIHRGVEVVEPVGHRGRLPEVIPSIAHAPGALDIGDYRRNLASGLRV